jgi:hypothetical protein
MTSTICHTRRLRQDAVFHPVLRSASCGVLSAMLVNTQLGNCRAFPFCYPVEAFVICITATLACCRSSRSALKARYMKPLPERSVVEALLFALRREPVESSLRYHIFGIGTIRYPIHYVPVVHILSLIRFIHGYVLGQYLDSTTLSSKCPLFFLVCLILLIHSSHCSARSARTFRWCPEIHSEVLLIDKGWLQHLPRVLEHKAFKFLSFFSQRCKFSGACD